MAGSHEEPSEGDERPRIVHGMRRPALGSHEESSEVGEPSLPGDPSARDDDDWDAAWADPPKGAKGRVLVGLCLLVLGVMVAVVALGQRGDDDESAGSKARAKGAVTTVERTSTTTEPRVTIVPTTLPGGVLPTGCGDWDPAFSFDPQPMEGVVVYSDFDGWHVRLGPNGPPKITGTVVGQTTPLVSTEPPGPGVQVIADPATFTVTFNLTAGDQPVGFDFLADCSQKQLTFDFKDQDGRPLDPTTVRLGRTGGTTTLPVSAQRKPPTG